MIYPGRGVIQIGRQHLLLPRSATGRPRHSLPPQNQPLSTKDHACNNLSHRLVQKKPVRSISTRDAARAELAMRAHVEEGAQSLLDPGKTGPPIR